MKIGIVGGTGLYDLPGTAWIGETRLETPFGAPSDVVVHGRLGGRDVFFLPRHGRGHRLLPSEINHRANIWALKALEVDTVLGVSAVGSLRADLHPRDILLPDQFIDRGKAGAAHTFSARASSHTSRSLNRSVRRCAWQPPPRLARR